MSLIVSNETTPATPSSTTTEVFVNSTKRLSSVDDAATVRIFVDRDSSETLTNKTLSGASLISPTLSGAILTNTTLTGTITGASQAGFAYVADSQGVGSKKIASGGPVALVTGTKVVATGLATVSGFVAIPSNQPTGTGTASHQILAATSITTGAVTVTAFSVSSVTGATVAASTSTGSFYWFAMGT